ncbi:MAG: hypothetical protein IPO21_16635 [Bacteroidales bacterium]|nr:hypothetical protein [Bacteroidales bacterium]
MRFITKLMLVAFLAGLHSQLFANDLIVAENGAGGAYSSITDALAASVDGDRIFITPKSGGAAYAEDLNLDKSIQLLSNKEGEFFTIQGEITVTPEIARKITIIGMRNLQGSITSTVASPEGEPCEVNIMNCDFKLGNILFDVDYFKMTIASNLIKGKVIIRNGKIIGNSISNKENGISVTVNSDLNISNDTILVVANKINNSYLTVGSTYNYGIYIKTTSHFFMISNNFVKYEYGSYYAWPTTYYYGYGIFVENAKNASNGKNTILNNTLYREETANIGGNLWGIYVSSIPADASVDIVNNLIVANASMPINEGIISYSNTGIVASNYNFFSNVTTAFKDAVDDGTNKIDSNTLVDNEGKLAANSDAIDGGNPDSVYYDIDLTRANVGVYGGSFTLDNFFPITGAARVYFVQAPRRVIIGNTIKIKAEAFDR